MRLYLIRHPQPLVESGICYGSSDVAVAAQECLRVSQALLSILPKGLRLISSPLRRCAELTAKIVDAINCESIDFDDRLVEMHFGDWELRAWDDIPRAEIDAWAADPATYRPGGGESVLQMAQRVCSFYDDLRLLRQDSIVVCHAGTIRLLLACQRGLSPTEMAHYAAQNPHKITYGECIILDC
jgi:alpha-ribazole phosphatase